MKNIRLLLHLSHSWMVHFSKLVMNLINIYRYKVFNTFQTHGGEGRREINNSPAYEL